MKNKKLIRLFKVFIILTIFLNLSACCNDSKNKISDTKIIGTLNDKTLQINHYNRIIEQEDDKDPKNVKLKEVALQKTLIETSLKEKNLFRKDIKQINTQLNNLKSQYGENYLSEAEKQYNYIVNDENELIDFLEYSYAYNNYIEEKANISNEQISKEFYDKHKTLYCSVHILTETEEQANLLLNKLRNNEKNFDDLIEEGKKSQKIREEEQKAANPNSFPNNNLHLDNFILSDVPVKQFSDLGCQPLDTFVTPFKEALVKLKEKEVTMSPIKTDFGYHIVKLDKIQHNNLDKKLQKRIKQDLIRNITSDTSVVAKYDKELLEGLNINITDEKIKQYYDKYINSLDEKIKRTGEQNVE